MKKAVVISLVTLATMSVGVCATPIPPSTHEDTEASIHLQMPPLAGQSYLQFAATFNASPSNSLTIAVGIDADDNGQLSLREQTAEFGWDAGEWFIRRRATSNWQRYAWAGTEGAHNFTVTRGLFGNTPRLSLLADGASLAHLDATDWLPTALLENGLVRVTTRGAGIAGTAEVVSGVKGTVFLLR